jgi:hypothetical protein
MSLHGSIGSTVGVGQKTIPRKEHYAFFAAHGVEFTFFVVVLFSQFS